MLPLLVAVLTLAALAVATLFFVLEDSGHQAESKPTPTDTATEPHLPPQHVVVFFGTLKGGSQRLAERLARALREAGATTELQSMVGYDTDLLPTLSCAAFVLATYEGGVPPPGCEAVIDSLAEAASDFRGSDLEMSGLRYAVFGCGNSEYPRRNFNAAARKLDRSLKRLHGVRVAHGFWGDDIDNRLEEQFDTWMLKSVPALTARPKQTRSPSLGNITTKTAKDGSIPTPGGEPPNDAGADEMGSDDSDVDDADEGEGLVDVEDIGLKMVQRVNSGADGKENEGAGRKQMVSDSLRKALTKQGYKVVGSHSGVKLCRWTKAMLRGRGGCYKHTFYGIASYSCMEATPSLACANKCVFCWRHHDNPVGTSFRWQIDDPIELVDGFEREHLKMIKQLKGIPGLKPDRYQDALSRIRHCALSLVGEPIIYPRINDFVRELHRRRISSFMVTNAQFPEQMEELVPCTQLYISIDAPTKEQLKLLHVFSQAVDRPLFSDFWERFNICVDKLATKRQRTVFRLTLVNGWNDSELGAYAELVKRGQPDLIEVKGVTYCGESKASPLTIKQCPFHHEVRSYCERLAEASGSEYALASEHEHSNCVLIARTAFRKDGVWHTWIDYERFYELFAAWERDGTPFTADDYTAPTPEWALYDSPAGGFDPIEVRVAGKGTKMKHAGC